MLAYLLCITIAITAIYVLIPHNWKVIAYGVLKLLKLLFQLRYHSYNAKHYNYNFLNDFEYQVKRHPNHTQFIAAENGQEITLHDMNIVANQVAHWANSLGYSNGDTIALMMSNRYELVTFWLGMGKRGCSTALINTNATGRTLLHAVTTALVASNRKILVLDQVIYDKLTTKDIEEIRKNNIDIHIWETLYTVTISHMSNENTPILWRQRVKERDVILYIFTSGTTGLPKASKISHSRLCIAAHPFGIMCHLSPLSRVYTCLPLYHSAAGVLGVSAVIKYNATMVLRRKFSVRHFSADCVKYKCTVFQYIGELCRYLTSASSNILDTQCNIQYCFGNGLTTEIWTKFQYRYHIQHIVEFYLATEGNCGLFNCFDKVGALGYIPPIFDWLYPVHLIRIDPDNKDQPLRICPHNCPKDKICPKEKKEDMSLDILSPLVGDKTIQETKWNNSTYDDNGNGVIQKLSPKHSSSLYTDRTSTSSMSSILSDVESHNHSKSSNKNTEEIQLCQLCNPVESGLLIAKIDESRVDRRFDGYTDTQTTQKKILTNVFQSNDCYFNTGDLMYRDKEGYYYWSDRVGDTFRWKGENVSTAEVGATIGHLSYISDVCVYGVQIPGCEGRAGMVAIVPSSVDITLSSPLNTPFMRHSSSSKIMSHSFSDTNISNTNNNNNHSVPTIGTSSSSSSGTRTVSPSLLRACNEFPWNELERILQTDLPSYARPLFIRMTEHIKTTGTFKHLKNDLMNEGFDINKITDDVIYFYDPNNTTSADNTTATTTTTKQLTHPSKTDTSSSSSTTALLGEDGSFISEQQQQQRHSSRSTNEREDINQTAAATTTTTRGGGGGGGGGHYVVLTPDIYNNIMSGKYRL